MTNIFYTPSGNPQTGSQGLSALMRTEFLLISAAFDAIAPFTATGNYQTTFVQQGNYTFNLPSVSGTTLATTANIATETTRAQAAEAANAAAIAAETARALSAEALLAPLTGLVGRNRLHNGAFEIAQRGTSGTQNGTPGIDRWSVYGSGGSSSWSQQANSGWTSRRQWQTSASLAPAAFMQMIQRIGAARCADLVGQPVTVQCQFSVTSTGSLSDTVWQVQIVAAGSVDNWGVGTTFVQGITFTPSATPTTFSWTFSALPSAAANGIELVFLGLQSNTTQTLTATITSVQLEAGSVASVFERDDPAIAFAKCQRFYQTFYYATGGSAAGAGTFTQNSVYIPAMRATPTISVPSVSYGNASGLTITAVNATSIGANLSAASAGNYFANGAMILSAEL